MRFAVALILVALAGCSAVPGRPAIETVDTNDWRDIATVDDADRLRGWRATFNAAVAQARDDGYAQEVAALGPLGEPDAALRLDAVPTGNFRCRTIKLGSKSGARTLAYVDYPFYRCRIRPEGGLHGLAKLSGSQRPVGLLFPDDDYRKVFLGTLVLGDEDRAMRYGADPQRDIAGSLQRVGDNLYRLVIPEPRFESKLDIIEIVPEN